MPDRDQVWIYTGDGHGHFTPHLLHRRRHVAHRPVGRPQPPDRGSSTCWWATRSATSCTCKARATAPSRRRQPRVRWPSSQLGNGQPDVLVANQQTDQVTVQAPSRGSPQFVAGGHPGATARRAPWPRAPCSGPSWTGAVRTTMPSWSPAAATRSWSTAAPASTPPATPPSPRRSATPSAPTRSASPSRTSTATASPTCSSPTRAPTTSPSCSAPTTPTATGSPRPARG